MRIVRKAGLPYEAVAVQQPAPSSGESLQLRFANLPQDFLGLIWLIALMGFVKIILLFFIRCNEVGHMICPS